MQGVLNNPSSFGAVVPSDSTRVTFRGLYVGGTGDIALSPDASTAATVFAAVQPGFFPIELEQGRVMSTGTTATLIIALR